MSVVGALLRVAIGITPLPAVVTYHPYVTYRMEDLPPRIASKLRTDLLTGCWLFVYCCDATGYGRVYWRGASARAHKVVYELLIGPVPPGLELDHVRARGCRWRNCCNPAHLEAVTHRENLLRGSTSVAERAAREVCPQGHDLVPGNLVTRRRGGRECAICNRERVSTTYQRDMQDPAKAAAIRAKAAERQRRYRERHS